MILVLVAGLVALTAPVQAQDNIEPLRRFGVVVEGDLPETETLHALGVSWVQVTFSWAALQPHSADEFEDDGWLTTWLADMDAAGIEVVGVIVDTPSWASDSGDPAAVPRGLDRPLILGENTWAVFVRALVRRYDSVEHWVIYDEPDVQRGEGHVRFAGDVADYARLLTVAQTAAHSVNPDVKIHLAAMNWWSDVAAGREPYLARLLEALPAGELPFDVVTLRARTGTAHLWTMLTETRALLDAAGLAGQSIWLETGLSPSPAVLLGTTPAGQADYVMQAAAAALASGVERMAVYRLADDAQPGSESWGLLAADGTQRPAFDAYARVIETLRAATAAEYFSHPLVDLVILNTRNTDVFVAWTTAGKAVQLLITSPDAGEIAHEGADAEQVVSLPVEYPAAFDFTLAPVQPNASGFVTVTGSPVFLVTDTAPDFFRVIYAVVDGEYIRMK